MEDLVEDLLGESGGRLGGFGAEIWMGNFSEFYFVGRFRGRFVRFSMPGDFVVILFDRDISGYILLLRSIKVG